MQPLPDDARRVLVVEDHPDTRALLAALLRLWGHGVHAAADAPAALAAAAAFRPDAAVLDLGLAGLDGLELARRLRAQPGPGGPLPVAGTRPPPPQAAPPAAARPPPLPH